MGQVLMSTKLDREGGGALFFRLPLPGLAEFIMRSSVLLYLEKGLMTWAGGWFNLSGIATAVLRRGGAKTNCKYKFMKINRRHSMEKL